jgi:hypothetical protein
MAEQNAQALGLTFSIALLGGGRMIAASRML